MLRGMMFVDHMNFDIALQNYYKSIGKQTPKLDYSVLFKKIVMHSGLNVDLIKTYIFIPKPDTFLMNDINLNKYYNWASKLCNSPYIDVVEGNYVARPVSDKKMDITDHDTYYKVEKGTDVNLSLYTLTKAFYNAYDVAFVASADTDYLKVYETIQDLGKLVNVVAIKEQNIQRIRGNVDNIVTLDDSFFSGCIR
ncbi:NYN domain-containing protein [Butyrivibrio sp. WCD2001]|uniref:NYN domain-containing protein n=1 Tax=Butyrivibrio sp. WCD2001 TaxID=1280681 RepID=UPI00047E60C6|nr:NYN domain-containing protein [Butyrivibrio sp. WCD2001]